MKREYAIFDLDGTLLDFEGISGAALRSVIARFGQSFTSDMHAAILGTPSSSWGPKLVEHYNLQDHISPDDLVHAYHEEVTLLFPEMQMMSGAEQLLRSLKRQNIPIAIATSSASHTVPLKTKHHPVFSECIDVVVTGDDPLVVNGKPSPDIFLLAAKRLGCENASACVVFEDAPSGVLGGIRAGMHVIAVPDFRYLSQSVFDSHKDLFANESVSVLPSLECVHVADFFIHS